MPKIAIFGLSIMPQKARKITPGATYTTTLRVSSPSRGVGATATVVSLLLLRAWSSVIQKFMSLNYEPSSEPLHIPVK